MNEAGNQGCAQRDKGDISWDIQIPLLSSSPVMKQLAIAIGIGITFVIAFVFILELIDGTLTMESLVSLLKLFSILIAILAGLALIAVLLLLGNRYAYTFTLSRNGISEATQPRQRRRNTVINLLLMLFSIFAGRPGGAGTAILAQSRQTQFIRWEEIDRVIPDPRHKTVELKKGWSSLMVVFCTAENYEYVSGRILSSVACKSPPS